MKIKMMLVLLAGLLLAACQPGAASPSAAAKVYTLNQEAGLFAAPEAGSAQIATLAEGTQVIPADGAATLACQAVEEAGMAFDLCKVEVLETRQVGWTLPAVVGAEWKLFYGGR